MGPEDNMKQDASVNVKLWVTGGFAFGALIAIMNWLFFYTLPESPMVHAVQGFLIVVGMPAQLLTLLCVQDGNIYAFTVVSYLMEILQWTVLGLIIGYWRYRKETK